MNKTEEALKMAIEALLYGTDHTKAVLTCKEALADLKQAEPVGEVWWHEGHCNVSIYHASNMPKEGDKLYTTPQDQSAEIERLSDADVMQIAWSLEHITDLDLFKSDFANAIMDKMIEVNK